jgi:gliding motility-associated-like protein
MSILKIKDQIIRFCKCICLLISLILSSNQFYSSHVPGGNITYQCVGPNTYVVTLTLYEDCGTAFQSNTNMSIHIDDDCGYNLPIQSLPNIIFQQEISQLCDSVLPFSECNGGTEPGVYMHVWQDTIVLPGPCDSWTFWYSSCCRNASNNLSGTGNSYYFEAILNSATAPCNSAPVITAQPIPYYCNNQPVIYNFGVYEPDGDILVYSLIDAMQSATTFVAYQTGYTGTTAIPGITIDPNTGELTFTPTTTGNYVVAVLIEEFDANGNLVGSIIQDFTVEVINCIANNNPAPPAGGISNFNSTGVQTGPTDLQLCEGDNVCFDIEFTDANLGDSIFLSTNANQIFPGATFTQNSYFSPASGTICFTVLPGSNPFSTIAINANDNACPVVGMSSMVVGVTVVSSTYAGQDVIMCLGIGEQLNASGGSNFNWTVLSGDPINLGTNFSCNNCPDPIANPAVSTVYQVTSNLSGGCTNIDTVEVTVVPDFTFSVISSTSSSCLMEDIGFQVNVTPNIVGYSYTWTPAANLNNHLISNPIFTPATPGNFSFEVEIVSADGCVHNDTIDVTVNAGVKPSILGYTSDSIPFCGTQVTLWGEVDTTLVSAGISDDFDPAINMSMWSSLNEAAAGSSCGVNSGTNALHFAGTSGQRWATTVGFNTAPCSTIDFCLFLGNSASGGSPCENCDAGDDVDLEYSIDAGLTWTLIQTFEHSWWDAGGQYANSWACFSIPIPSAAVFPNTMFRWYQTPTSGGGAATGFDNWSLDDVQITCSTLGNYVYEWTPTNGIASVFNDTVLLTAPMSTGLVTYQIIVTDTVGNCSDTAEVVLYVMCDTCMAPIPTLTPVTCYGGNDGAVLAQPAGIDGPPWIVELVDPITSAIIQSDNNVITTVTFSGLSAGDYIVRSIDTAGCYADTLVTILEPPQMVLTVSNDTIICIGGTAVISASATGGTGPYTFDWPGLTGSGPHSVSPAISNYYLVTAVDDLGCVSSQDSILVAINPPILLTPSANDTVCPGGTGTLSVVANGGQGGTYNYVWTDASGVQVGNTSTVDLIPTASPATYYVMVTDNCETPAAYDSLLVYWYQEPQVSFLTTNNTGCYPIEPSFTNATPSNQVSSCVWNFGDATTSTVCGTVSHVYDEPGTYTVSLTITSPEGCVNDTVMTNLVEVYDYPTAAFDATPNPTDILNPIVEFIDQSSVDVVSYSWTFMNMQGGVIGSSSTQNPSYTFPDENPDLYEAQLTVTNADGCTDTEVMEIVVNGVFTCYVPTAFTPDGDGVNDFFFVKGESIDAEVFNFSIYNKWGERVFEAESMDTKWDGSYKNLPAQEDIYIWKLDTKDAVTGEHKEFTGHVILMR